MKRGGSRDISTIAIVALAAFAVGKCSNDDERDGYQQPNRFLSDTSDASHAPSRVHDGTAFANCSEARAAGAAPVYAGEPGYAPRLDRDGDGVGCE